MCTCARAVIDRKNDLLGDRLSGRGYDPVCMLEGHKGHLESETHETRRGSNLWPCR